MIRYSGQILFGMALDTYQPESSDKSAERADDTPVWSEISTCVTAQCPCATLSSNRDEALLIILFNK